jgi:hypothetical protein
MQGTGQDGLRLTWVCATSPARWKVHSTCACSERGSHSRKALPPSTPKTFLSSSVGLDESWYKENVKFTQGRTSGASSGAEGGGR